MISYALEVATVKSLVSILPDILKLFLMNLNIFVQFDREHFSEVFVDLKWFESKVGNKYLNEAAGVAAEEARNYKEKKKSKVSIFLGVLSFF